MRSSGTPNFRPNPLRWSDPSVDNRPTVVIACRVMQELLQGRLADDLPVTYMDIALHNTPKRLAGALQAELDRLPVPSRVFLGYGLCGNGLSGVRAGEHTLIIPRTHDCVAIFLGSHQRYVQRFFAAPNTYYLTRGWIEANDEPLTDYLDYVRDYGQDDADYLVEMKYRHYRKLCMVGFTQEELDKCRPRALEIAQFCGERWGMVYEEVLGTTELLDRLCALTRTAGGQDSEFVVVQPGDEITPELFMRADEVAPPATSRKG